MGNVAVEEKGVESVKHSNLVVTIFSGPLLLPEGKQCRVFDIAGRTVLPENARPGIYFIEIDGVFTKTYGNWQKIPQRTEWVKTLSSLHLLDF